MNIKKFIIFTVFIILSTSKGFTQVLDAQLVSQISKDSIYSNECFVVSIQLRIGDKNDVPLRFDDQLNKYVFDIKSKLEHINGIKYDSEISEIKGVKRIYDGKSYTIYKIVNKAICPIKAEDIIIPSMEIYLNVMDSSRTEVLEKINLISTSEKITVQELPSSLEGVYENQIYKLVGNFWIEEPTLNTTTFNLCDTINYTFKVRGTSISEMIEWEDEKKNDGNKIILVNRNSQDKISGYRIHMSRSFTFKIVLTAPGRYNMGNYFKWNYYSLESHAIKQLAPKTIINVIGSEDSILCAISHENNQSPFVVAMDISQSMELEDYNINRLHAAKEYLTTIFQDTVLAYPLILFGGEAKVYQSNNLTDIDSLRNNFSPGTAIGNAIYEGLRKIEGSSSIKKTLVIIGDGDNTSGFLSVDDAIDIAKSKGVKIHSIGVGHSGKVPFGTDYFGRTRFIENTYNENTLRKIAEKTGGTFTKLEETKITIKSLIEGNE